MNTSVSDQAIYTLRHAAIDFGKRRIIAGRMDPPINPEGVDQIKQMLAAGVPLEYKLVVSSPLRRALQTATLVTGLTTDQMITSYLCMERNYGRLEGVEPKERAKVQPSTYYVSVGGVEHSLNPPDGETLEQLRDRVITFHDFVRSLKVEDVLIVSHGTFLAQYHGYLRGLDVYHSLESSVAYLELNAFRFRGDSLASEEQLYLPEQPDQPW